MGILVIYINMCVGDGEGRLNLETLELDRCKLIEVWLELNVGTRTFEISHSRVCQRERGVFL